MWTHIGRQGEKMPGRDKFVKINMREGWDKSMSEWYMFTVYDSTLCDTDVHVYNLNI